MSKLTRPQMLVITELYLGNELSKAKYNSKWRQGKQKVNATIPHSLIEKGLITMIREDGFTWYYGLTEKGRDAK